MSVTLQLHGAQVVLAGGKATSADAKVQALVAEAARTFNDDDLAFYYHPDRDKVIADQLVEDFGAQITSYTPEAPALPSEPGVVY